MVFKTLFNKDLSNFSDIKNIIDSYNTLAKQGLGMTADFDSINKLAESIDKKYEKLGETLKGLNGKMADASVVSSLVRKNLLDQAKAAAITTVKTLALKAAMGLFVGLVAGAVTLGVQKLTEFIDEQIVTYEEATEAIKEHTNTIEQSQNDIETYNAKLQENKEKIKEIQALGTLSLTDQADIRNLQKENDNLELQISLLKKKIELEQQAKIKSARDAYKAGYSGGLFKPENLYNAGIVGLTLDDYQKNGSAVLAASAAEGTENINTLIASLRYLREEYNKTSDAEEKSGIGEYISSIETNLMNQAQSIQDIYDILVTSTDAADQQIASSLKGTLDVLYQLLVPETYFQQQLDSLDDGIKEALRNILSESKNASSDLADIISGLKDGTSDAFDGLSDEAKEGFMNYISEMENAGKTSKEVCDSIVSYLFDLSSGVETATSDIAKSWTDINESIDGIQAAYKNLSEAVIEYNKHGYLSMDTLQDLLTMNDSYLACLVNQNGQLKLNMSSFQDLATAQLESAKATAIAQAIEELKNVADQDEISVSAGSAQALANKGKVVAQLANQYVNLANCASLAAQAEALADAYTGAVTRNAGAATKIMQGLNAKLGLINSAMKGVNKSATGAARSLGGFNDKSNAAAEAAKKLKEALEEQKDALEKQKKALEKQNDVLKAQGEAIKKEIEKRIDALKDQKDAASDAIDAEIDGLQEQIDTLEELKEQQDKTYSSEIDSLEELKEQQDKTYKNQIDKLKELKEQQDKVYKAQIDELTEKKEALQKANDEEDRAIKLAELQEALEKAKSQRTTRVYSHNIGFTWENDENAVQEAQNAIDDQQRTWAREDAIQAIEDEINALERLKDAFDEETENQIDNLEKAKDAFDEDTENKIDNLEKQKDAFNEQTENQIDNLEKQIEALEKNQDAIEANFDAQIDKLEDLKDKYADTISLIGMSWEEYQAQAEAAAMASGMSFDSMVSHLGTYKNSIIENMQALSEVEAQITEIEEKISEATKAISDSSNSGSGGSGGGNSLPAMVISSLDSIKEKIKECGEENNNLSSTLVELQNQLDNAVFGSTLYEEAVDGIKTTNTLLGDNILVLNGLMDEYAQTVVTDSSLSQDARDSEFQSVITMLAGYGVSYDTLNTYLSNYLSKVQETYGAASTEYQNAATDIGYVQAALNESIGPFGDYIDKINSTASEIEILRGQEADLTTATDILTEGTAAHFHALDQLGVVQSDISTKQQALTGYIDEATIAIDNATLATDEAKESQLLYLDSLVKSLQPKIDDKTATDEQAASEENATEKTKELTSAAKEANEQAIPAFQNVGAAGKQAGEDIANSFNSAASSVRSARETIEAECARISRAIEDANRAAANVSSSIAGSHAIGSRYIQKTGIHQVDEEGPETIVRRPQAGRYTYLERGDIVAPAYASKNIWDMATNPDDFLDKHLGGLGKYVYPSVNNKSEQNSVSIGDVIIQQPVGDINSLARAIQRELPNTALRTLNKR